MSLTINIDMDAKCAECKKGGATPNQLCLSCTTRAAKPTPRMRSEAGRIVQDRWKTIRAKRRD